MSTKRYRDQAGLLSDLAQITPGCHPSAFAVYCSLRGFDLAAFDLWLSVRKPGKAKNRLLDHRANLERVARANNHDAVTPYVVLLRLAWLGIERETFLLPLAQTGHKVRAGAARSNAARQIEADKRNKKCDDEWNAEAQKLWKTNPRLSKTTVATRILRALPREPGGKAPRIDVIRKRITRAR